jgi:hypothetical protein
MKILSISLLMALSVIISSCSKEEVVAFDEGLLTGSWNMTTINYTGTSTTTYAGVSTVANFTGTGKDMDLTVQFTKDPNNFTSSGSYSIELKTQINGQTVTETYEFSNFMMPGSWSIKGDKLTIEAQSQSQDATIKKLNNAELIIMGQQENKVSQSGVTVTQKVSVIYSFEKI